MDSFQDQRPPLILRNRIGIGKSVTIGVVSSFSEKFYSIVFHLLENLLSC